MSADVPVFSNPCYDLALKVCGKNLPFAEKMSDMELFFICFMPLRRMSNVGRRSQQVVGYV
jgi:hypothetical protein